ncbi:MAG: hypothetical protein ACU843_16275 [Gammaproteobacteria bacterium]
MRRLGSTAKFDLHVYRLVVDGIYRTDGGTPEFQPILEPSAKPLQTQLSRIIKKDLD